MPHRKPPAAPSVALGTNPERARRHNRRVVLETLRQQEIELRSQLELTTRKLENLTDIERQLSSRKPGGNFSPDAGHGGEKVPEVIHDDP